MGSRADLIPFEHLPTSLPFFLLQRSRLLALDELDAERCPRQRLVTLCRAGVSGTAERWGHLT